MKTSQLLTTGMLFLLSFEGDGIISRPPRDAEIPTSWLDQVQEDIRASEYEIRWSDSFNAFNSPNRAQNLRFTYHPRGFSVQQRTTRIPLFDTNDRLLKESEKTYEEIPPWEIAFVMKRLDKGAEPIIFSGATLEVRGRTASSEDDHVKIEYTNSEAGMRQDFIVKRRPEGNAPLRVDLAVETRLEMRVGANGIAFWDADREAMRYAGLKAWDADDRHLAAMFEQKDDGVSIVVADEGARYPVTIDPLSTTSNWTAESNKASAQFGQSVSTAGDVNGDGYSDVIVGAPYYDNEQTEEGRAFVYHGSASGLSTTSNWTAESDQVGALFGGSVSTAGDVNGDGYSDVIVGAAAYDNEQSNEGRAFVYHGSASGLSATSNWTAESDQVEAYFGESVSTAADVNGDGYSDVIVGAIGYSNGQTNEGRAFVFHGSASGLSTTSNWTAESNQADAEFGWWVSTAGDVNGDGYSDVIMGAYVYDNDQSAEGRAFVYHGSASGLSTTSNWTAESNQAGALFGVSVSTAGDVNGDGYSDVIVGASGYDSDQYDEGRAFVYHGSASGLSTTSNWTAESDQVNAFFGISVSTAGDVNGDGYSDIIVGAIGYSNGQTNEGRAFVYYGSASGLSTTSNWTAESDQVSAQFGYSVSTAGDVNGDGYSDVIVGANLYDNIDSDVGRAFVYHGSASGLSTASNWTAESEQVGAQFGWSVSTAGDVNGDGYSDVIVGAPYYDHDQTDEGRAFVYHGSASGLSTTSNWTAESDQTSANFGFSVSTAGDVNGDGYSDVIVGASSYDNEGRAFVYHGSSTGLSIIADWTAESDQVNAVFGSSVSTAGDVNGDGYSDVIVGAYLYDNGQSEEGRAFVYHGSSSGLSTIADWTAESNQAFAYFGSSASTAGDVNGDGYSDVIVGAYGYSNEEGRAFVYHGSSSGLSTTSNWTAESDQAFAFFGSSVSTAGDVNGDGYSDVIVGALAYDNGQSEEGRAFVYHGSSSGLSTIADWTAESDQASAFFGSSVSTAGDVNGDGYSDVIVGASGYSNGQSDEGRAFVYHGSASGLPTTSNWTAESDQAFAYFGYSVSTAGDVNGDGYSDVIVGAYLFDNGQTDEGRAFVYYGNGGNGMHIRPRQWRTDLITPVATPLKTRSTSQAGLGLLGRTFFGRSDVKVQFEVKALGTPFDATGVTETGMWTDVGTAGTQIDQLISGLSDRTMYKWRARVKYRLTDCAPQPYGRWIYPNSNGGLGESDFQISDDDNPLPVTMAYFTAIAGRLNAELRWRTESEAENYGFEIERRVVQSSKLKVQGDNPLNIEPGTWNRLGFVQGAGTSSSPRDYSFTDKPDQPGRYGYRIKQIDHSGSFVYTDAVELEVGLAPLEFNLAQNYPNPFNPTTTIEFTLPEDGRVKLRIYNMLGEEVVTLVDEERKAGVYQQIVFDASRLSTGVYISRLEFKERQLIKKMLLVK